MRCEIIAVGTELLLGQIADTNSSWIGERLALAGIDSHFQVKVGDNRARIVEAIRHALSRSDAVILCGGLGPTQDDVTREALAEAAGVALVRDEAMGEKIRAGFEARGRRFARNNLRQADRPEGAAFIPEMPGTAPGLVCPVGGRGPTGGRRPAGGQVIYAVPGVPFEMREMMEGTILPDLQRRAGAAAMIRSRVLKSWGESESRLAELLAGRIEALDRAGNPTIAFQASGIEGLKIRITAKAGDVVAAEALIAGEEAEVRAIVGDAIFGADAQTMESVVLDLLRGRALSLAVAESLTGGLVGARLTAVPGASEVFRGAVASYASEVKFDLLGVPRGPVVSADAAKAMALEVRKRLGADVGIATTGVAGPAEQEGYPPGTVFLGLAHGGRPEALRVRLPGDRHRVREYAAISVLNLLRLRDLGLVEESGAAVSRRPGVTRMAIAWPCPGSGGYVLSRDPHRIVRDLNSTRFAHRAPRISTTRQFVTDCRAAVAANDAVTATRAVVRKAVRALASGVVALPPLDSIHVRRRRRSAARP